MDMKTTNLDNEYFLAQWIDGQISDSEFKKLVSKEDYIAYKKIKSGIHLYEELEKPLNSTYSKIKAKIKNRAPKKTLTIQLYTKIAIYAAASIILFFGITQFIKTNDIVYLSNYGEQKEIALLDDSEIILNAKSQLKYNKKDWKNKREVYLDGEAFFKVTKGKTFTVVTNNGNITVLGTQFNINTNSDFFEVTCYQGKVKVSSSNNHYILTPKLSVRKSNGVFLKETLPLQESNPSWINGESSFRRVPLKQVIMALEKQFNIKFDTKNIDDSIIFTGSFDNKNLNIALTSVFETVNIKYTILDKKILLSK
jgi:transmembrane sensor